MSIIANIFDRLCGKKTVYKVKTHFIKSPGVEDLAFMSQVTRSLMTGEAIVMIAEQARRQNVSGNLINAICQQESNLIFTAIRHEPQLRGVKWYQDACYKYALDADDVWNTISVGLMQILYVNCFDYMSPDYRLTPIELIGRPEHTLAWGIKHFKKELSRYDGNIEKAISAYNAGHATEKNYENYTLAVLNRYHELEKKA